MWNFSTSSAKKGEGLLRAYISSLLKYLRWWRVSALGTKLGQNLPDFFLVRICTGGSLWMSKSLHSCSLIRYDTNNFNQVS
jgi:hypothetical protein